LTDTARVEIDFLVTIVARFVTAPVGKLLRLPSEAWIPGDKTPARIVRNCPVLASLPGPVPFFPGFVQFAFKNDKEVSRDVAVAAINAAPSQALPGSWLPSEIVSGHCIVTLQNRPA
jgi:hypothetical protein